MRDIERNLIQKEVDNYLSVLYEEIGLKEEEELMKLEMKMKEKEEENKRKKEKKRNDELTTMI